MRRWGETEKRWVFLTEEQQFDLVVELDAVILDLLLNGIIGDILSGSASTVSHSSG